MSHRVPLPAHSEAALLLGERAAMRLSRVARLGASATEAALKSFSRFAINPQRLADVAEFGSTANRATYLTSCEFLRNECAVRLAHIVQEIRALPPVYFEEENIQRVHSWYYHSFEDLVNVEPPAEGDAASEDRFAKDIMGVAMQITDRHKPTVMTMAVAMQRLLRKGAIVDVAGTVEFLDRLFMARIGVRFLFTQHMSAFVDQRSVTPEDERKTTTGSRWVGSIDRETNVVAIAEHAAEAARMLCFDKYFDAPSINVDVEGGLDHPFMYIPSHLYHIFFELLKNSCRAVTEYHDGETSLPPISVLVVRGEEDMSIRISDRGGGLARRVLNENLFTYLYSTAETPEFFERAVDGDHTALTDMNNAPLAGFGYGLPISRLYARYLGGELTLECMDGFGTDAYVSLQAHPELCSEVLPSFTASQVEYTTNLHKYNPSHWLDQRPSLPKRGTRTKHFGK